MTKQELHQRILEGHRRVDQLCGIADKLPKGQKRDEVGEKSVRLLQSLHNLEDGFCELHENECLFIEKGCLDRNKGCFPCQECSSYWDTIYASEQVKLF